MILINVPYAKEILSETEKDQRIKIIFVMILHDITEILLAPLFLFCVILLFVSNIFDFIANALRQPMIFLGEIVSWLTNFFKKYIVF